MVIILVIILVDSAIYGDGIVRSKNSMDDYGSRDDGILDNDVLLFRMV